MKTRAGYIDRNKLQSWADTRPSQSDFPRLVRRLILETTPGLVELGMPAGDGVAAGDWDGSVRTTEATAWVAGGSSVWELSVNSSPNTKADDDYSKRRQLARKTQATQMLESQTMYLAARSALVEAEVNEEMTAQGMNPQDQMMAQQNEQMAAQQGELAGDHPLHRDLRAAEHGWQQPDLHVPPPRAEAANGVQAGHGGAVDPFEVRNAGHTLGNARWLSVD